MEDKSSKFENCKSSTISINHFKLKIPPAFIPDKWVCDHKHKKPQHLDNKRPKTVRKKNDNHLIQPKKSLPFLKNENKNNEILQAGQENNYREINDNKDYYNENKNNVDVNKHLIEKDFNNKKIHINYLNIEKNGFMTSQYNIKQESIKQFKYIGFENFQEFVHKNIRKFRKRYLKSKNLTLERIQKKKKKAFLRNDGRFVDKYSNKSLKIYKKGLLNQKKFSKKKNLKKDFRRKLNYIFKSSLSKTNNKIDFKKTQTLISLYNKKRDFKYFCLNFLKESKKDSTDLSEKK
jgi:hypothetical protein